MVTSLGCGKSEDSATTPPAVGDSNTDKSDNASKDTEKKSDTLETVPLHVAAFVASSEPDGRRTDPVSKYIEEKLNIELHLSTAGDGEWGTKLNALIASNDLPDIFLLSDVSKQLPMLIKSKQILALDDYLKDYAPNLMEDPNARAMMLLNRDPKLSPDGNLYTLGLCKGSWADVSVPTCSHYIRWDLYSKLGYPKLENYDEDLLNVLKSMQDLENTTADGKKVYAMGGWFSEGQGWGDWIFDYGLAGGQEGVGFLTADRTLLYYNDDNHLESNNQLKDPNSYFWRTVKFYTKANQMGILDPDSFTQPYSTYEEKVHDGRYLYVVPGWVIPKANKNFETNGTPEKALVSLPAFTDIEGRVGMMVKGERQYAIYGGTKYPERCVMLLDFISSYDFSRIAFNGLEGTNWNMENGKPVPTDEYLNADISDDKFLNSTGAGVYHHFMGYGNGTIDPVTGTAIDLFQFSDKATEKSLTPAHRDMLKHYGKSTLYDLYTNNVKEHRSYNGLYSLGEAPEELKPYVANLES